MNIYIVYIYVLLVKMVGKELLGNAKGPIAVTGTYFLFEIMKKSEKEKTMTA